MKLYGVKVGQYHKKDSLPLASITKKPNEREKKKLLTSLMRRPIKTSLRLVEKRCSKKKLAVVIGNERIRKRGLALSCASDEIFGGNWPQLLSPRSWEHWRPAEVIRISSPWSLEYKVHRGNIHFTAFVWIIENSARRFLAIFFTTAYDSGWILSTCMF